MSFSNEFLWGVATSAFQYEGAYLEDGKGWTVADERCKKKNKISIQIFRATYNRRTSREKGKQENRRGPSSNQKR